MELTPEQWMIGILAALMVGITKTGIPGIGILVVPLMAIVFGGRLSVGATLPLLIFGDIFAVLWYRQRRQAVVVAAAVVARFHRIHSGKQGHRLPHRPSSAHSGGADRKGR